MNPYTMILPPFDTTRDLGWKYSPKSKSLHYYRSRQEHRTAFAHCGHTEEKSILEPAIKIEACNYCKMIELQREIAHNPERSESIPTEGG